MGSMPGSGLDDSLIVHDDGGDADNEPERDSVFVDEGDPVEDRLGDDDTDGLLDSESHL